jgi:hypothetical protein
LVPLFPLLWWSLFYPLALINSLWSCQIIKPSELWKPIEWKC